MEKYNRNGIEEKINTILTDVLGIYEEEITPDAQIKEDFDFDSLDMVHLVMKIEEEFPISITDDKIYELHMGTYKELCDFVEYKLNTL